MCAARNVGQVRPVLDCASFANAASLAIPFIANGALRCVLSFGRPACSCLALRNPIQNRSTVFAWLQWTGNSRCSFVMLSNSPRRVLVHFSKRTRCVCMSTSPAGTFRPASRKSVSMRIGVCRLTPRRSDAQLPAAARVQGRVCIAPSQGGVAAWRLQLQAAVRPPAMGRGGLPPPRRSQAVGPKWPTRRCQGPRSPPRGRGGT